MTCRRDHRGFDRALDLLRLPLLLQSLALLLHVAPLRRLVGHRDPSSQLQNAGSTAPRRGLRAPPSTRAQTKYGHHTMGYEGLSATSTSVVRNSAAIDAAFCSAERVTLAGSTMPALIMSTYSPVSALRPWPGGREVIFSATTPPSRPALIAICLSGAVSAARTMFTPVFSSPARSSLSNAVTTALAKATPP